MEEKREEYYTSMVGVKEHCLRMESNKKRKQHKSLYTSKWKHEQ